MGQTTKIAWTHHTFNPWWGCVKVSAGCANCYAETLAKRFGYNVWGANSPRRMLNGDAHWREPFKWNRDAERANERRRVMCGSMCDVFELAPRSYELDRVRERLFALIPQTPWLDCLVITKRTENIAAMLPIGLQSCNVNVRVIASVEDQPAADKRIPELLSVRGLHGLSIEPMLGAVDLRKWLAPWSPEYTERRIGWVIVGGESGPHARPMNPNHVRELRNQCVEAGVPFFFKQWGRWRPCNIDGVELMVPDSKREHELPVLDGKTWMELPCL